jgi:hypothetical protein
MLRELHFPPSAKEKQVLEHYDVQGHLLRKLEIDGTTTCCTLPVKVGQRIVLDGVDFKITKESGPIHLDAPTVTDKEPCPASVVPPIEPSGTPPVAPKRDVASMTPAERLKAGLRPVRVGNEIVWQ